MRWDFENQLSVNQAFTGAAAVSTHSYQKQSAAQDIGIGRRLALLVAPSVAGGAGSSSLIEAIQADDAALTSNVEVLSSVTIAAALLTVGSYHEVPIPQGKMTKQFLGARITITGGTTTLTANIYIVPQDEIPAFKAFPKQNNPVI
jgi:hypothetical protein